MLTIRRFNKQGREFLLTEISPETTRVSLGPRHIVVNSPIAQLSQSWYCWQMRGDSIQDAFPYLKADEREFFISGLTQDLWDKIFKEE